MHIIEAIPLTPLPQNSPQLLSYFFERPLNKGSLIEAALGRRQVKALVVSSTPLEELKGTLKKTDFQLKGITKILDEKSKVSSFQLSLAAWLARYYYAPLGQALKAVLPSYFSLKKYSQPLVENPPLHSNPLKATVIQTNARTGQSEIEELIRQYITKGQVLLLLPDKTILDFFSQQFMTFQPAVLHSQLSNKTIFQTHERIANGEAKLIIGTRLALFAPFPNLKLLLVEDPSNEVYKSDMSPRYHATQLAEQLAQLHQAELISITPQTSIEEFHNPSLSFIARQSKSIAIEIVDMVQELKAGNFSTLSQKLQKEIIEARKSKKSILLYSARRAYASTLVCRHCGFVVRCDNCSVPMRVYAAPGLDQSSEGMLVCYHCSAYQQMPNACPNCSSTKLRAGGMPGSQKIKEEVEYLLQKNQLDSKNIFLFDSDLLKTPEEELELLKAVTNSAEAIVIATQLIFSHRYYSYFKLVAIPISDALGTNPDFRTDERILYQLAKLRDFEPEKIIIQTHNLDNQALQAFATNTTETFYESELGARKLFAYPPFSRLIKLSYRHRDPQRAAQAARILNERLKMAIAQLGLKELVQRMDPIPAFIAKENNYYQYNIVLKVSPELPKLETILKYVPSDWIIDPDPRSIA